MTDYVYVIQQEGSDICKIGISNRPHFRLQEVQAYNPFNLHIAMLFEVYDGKARAVEALLHRHFQNRRIHREWFSIAPQAVYDAVVNEPKMYNHVGQITDGMGVPVAIVRTYHHVTASKATPERASLFASSFVIVLLASLGMLYGVAIGEASLHPVEVELYIAAALASMGGLGTLVAAKLYDSATHGTSSDQ